MSGLLAQIDTATAEAVQSGGQALVSAASSQPALYILVLLVIFIAWEVRKELREGRIERQSTSNTLVSMLTEVMDRNDEGRNECHDAQKAQATAFAEHRVQSERLVTDAIVRCSAAVEAGQRTNDRAIVALDHNSQVMTQVMGLLQHVMDNKFDGAA